MNEAFAVVPMAFMARTGVDHASLNVHGGACALGHPIGASGARILVTLLHALERRDKATGMAAICIGGGEGTAIAIERVWHAFRLIHAGCRGAEAIRHVNSDLSRYEPVLESVWNAAMRSGIRGPLALPALRSQARIAGGGYEHSPGQRMI